MHAKLCFIMHFSRVVILPLAIFSSMVMAIPNKNFVERQSRPDNHTLNRERADAVKAAFTYAWNGYSKYAFPNDELHPVSNGFGNSRYISQQSV